MTARLSLYQKAENELYKMESSVKTKFYDFCHQFRLDPDHPSLDLKPLKGDGRIFRAKIDRSYRALLARAGVGADGIPQWLIVAVRHRREVYEELTVAINRITGEIEFVDLGVVGQSVLQRAGLQLTPAPDEQTVAVEPMPAPVETPEPAVAEEPLLVGCTPADLSRLGVTDALIDLALTVTTDEELDQLIAGAPRLTAEVLTGLGSGMSVDEVEREITQPAATELEPGFEDDMAAALRRTAVTTVDDDIRNVLAEGDFRAWKVYLHPTQRKIVERNYGGPARVSGGPGTGKTIVALHRVARLAAALPPGHNKPILLTTYTKNLTADLRSRLSSLMDPVLLGRVDIKHIDQLAQSVLNENTAPGSQRSLISEEGALDVLREVLFEHDEQRWGAEFLFEEWEQIVLGQSLATRQDYFKARRAGMGRALSRPERAAIWKLLEQFALRLNGLGRETWAQAAERAARYEMERAHKIKIRAERKADIGGGDLVHLDDNSSAMRYVRHRYQHIVVDEAQDLSPAHWKMLRAMVASGEGDLFIASDTHQRIYDRQVTLSTVGVQIRGRASKLTLSYRTTQEILDQAAKVVSGATYDDLDDGTDTLDGYHSLLHGPVPEFIACADWTDEIAQLAEALKQWRAAITQPGADGTVRDPSGTMAVCVADGEMAGRVASDLAMKHGITTATLTKEGPQGSGEVHIGTMHRFKGLEYQKLAIIGASDGILPRTALVEQYEQTDPTRYERELRKSRNQLFVAATRARDALRISWHGKPSPFLPL
ncbi:DNA-dependent helicase II [Streptomyces lavendulae subsp. lavendulae]|uniref:DNA 3'-5' helicase n=1 Tax=Streptomyces lavendulae subsp. lavendulae TaxID=58340 RepID=A0A2K8PBS0_STRLA|nr:UvrD-helicase domain-containing protein [Streptomyces lavendulae]ATZ23085.1 DNA-dependent helicase II [Streptomyces lavendulae subsp. lavendulae]QUQ52922.1 ATP-dependent DNA helicase Rep [Streptomyces lavendulae subsp. lavendulae]